MDIVAYYFASTDKMIVTVEVDTVYRRMRQVKSGMHANQTLRHKSHLILHSTSCLIKVMWN